MLGDTYYWFELYNLFWFTEKGDKNRIFNIRINPRGSIVATFFNLDDLTIDYNAN